MEQEGGCKCGSQEVTSLPSSHHVFICLHTFLFRFGGFRGERECIEREKEMENRETGGPQRPVYLVTTNFNATKADTVSHLQTLT